ncbi:MAG: helix-turn-helix transcriptional regulator [Sporolactobacillus sp.]
MPINNLRIAMAKRKMGISELSRKTGLSRTTIFNLYYEKSKGIEFVTLDKICKALQCSIDEIMVFPIEDEKEAVK